MSWASIKAAMLRAQITVLPVRRAPTPSQAAKVLSDCARANKAKRAATYAALCECVATGRTAKLGWRA